MAIKRLLTGSSFAPESVAVIQEAYEIARAELGLAPGSEQATELAKFLLAIAAAKTELDARSLASEVKTAWTSRDSKDD